MASRPRKETETLEQYHANLKVEEAKHQKRMEPIMFWPSSKKGTYYKQHKFTPHSAQIMLDRQG